MVNDTLAVDFQTSEKAGHRMQEIPLSCPPETEILPCKCQLKGLEVIVKCENSVLINVASALEKLMKWAMRIEELHLQGNRIHVLPARVFGTLQVNKLFLINNELLGINRNAFAGLETSLQHLYITDPELFNVPFDTLDNLSNLRTCVLENTDITSIPRLNSLSKLEFLKIDGSRVTTIPSSAFKFMPNMKKVHIANSRLKEINGNVLEGLVYLEEVNLSNNIIDYIHPRAFRTLPMVEYLTLSGNNIEEASMVVLAARELRELKTFDISHNRISELSKGSFVDMPTVEIIDVSSNRISKVEHGAFFRLPALRTLELSGNKLREFHADIFTESPNVEHLTIARNNLTFLAEMIYISRALPNLLSIDVSSNHLKAENLKSFGGHRKLEALKLDHNKIEKLTKGMFQDLPNLRELYLSYNSIKSDIDGQIWNLPKLRVLDLSYNDLESIDVMLLEGVSQLSTLDLSFNVINAVREDAFLSLAYLENLNMSFNSLSELPKEVFLGLGDLFELELSFNELMSLENGMLQGLSSLQYLHITHNQILAIEENVFLDTPNLRFLDLSSNFIQSIPKEALTKLTALIVLKLRQNVIDKIQGGYLSGMRILEHLDLSRNHIQNISQTAFQDMSVLRDLDLSINFIQRLHSDMFSSTKLLEKLNVSHNYISDLGQNTFTESRRLRILDVTNNSLTELGNDVQGLLSLQGLFMSYNYVSTLKNTTFHNLPNLSVLDFSNNGLQTFEPGTFYNMESLVTLDLRNNNLVELNPESFKALYSLRELHVCKNQISVIKDFAFIDLPSLRSLEMQDNVITEIGDHAFQNMPSLNFLNLSRNGLQDVPADALARLSSLDVLDLSWNYVLEITDLSFQRLEWLTVLMLHDNDLCRLSNGAFSKQRALRVLTLHNNQLRRLHLQALGITMPGLSLLDMSGNPFQCDCDLVWLKEYLNEDPNDHRIPRRAILGDNLRGVPVCAAPPEYEGLPITEVPVEAFLCETRLIPGNGEEEICVPRFLDPLLFTGGHSGAGALEPGAVNTLLHLTNLSDTILKGGTGPSYLDVNNPILVHNLQGLSLVSEIPTELSAGEQLPVTASIVQNTAETSLQSANQNQEQLLSSSNIHTVTGDTPTIYAGSGSGHSDDVKQDSQPGTGLFSGLKFPTLPNIIESLTNLNLPNIGLNVNWGNLPIGRQESGALPNVNPLSGDKPMKGPDENQPIWIDGPASPHPLFTAPPPPPTQESPPPTLSRGPAVAANTHVNSGHTPLKTQNNNSESLAKSPPSLSFSGIPGHIIPIGRPTNVWRLKPKPGQVQAVRPAQKEHSQSLQPNNHQRKRPIFVHGSFHPQASTPKSVLPPVMHSGPGPNSGKPFLPGLSANQQDNSHIPQSLIVNHEDSVSQRDNAVSQNTALLPPPSPVDVVPGGRNTNWEEPKWSPPEVINPYSGVSLYQPGEPFHPYQPDDPNHPITVVDAPNISISHRGTPSPSSPTPPKTFSISTSSHKSPVDMSPSESQIAGGGNIFTDNKKASQENAPELPPHQRDYSTTALPPDLSKLPDFADYDNHESTFRPKNATQGKKENDEAYDDINKNQDLEVKQEIENPEVSSSNKHQEEPQEDEQQKTTLGDLINLLYAAEEEAQKEAAEEEAQRKAQENLDDGSPLPDIHNLTHDTSKNVSIISDIPEKLEFASIFTSTTETLPLTSSFTITTNSSVLSDDLSFSEDNPSSSKIQNSPNILDPPADIFPPQLGDGVTVLKDLPPNTVDKSFPDQVENTFIDNQPSGVDIDDGYYGPYSEDINDRFQSPSDHPDNEKEWPFSSERSPDPLSPTKFRPGFVVPVDKSGDPLPGARTRPNNTYISPSKSVGRGGFPTIERVKMPGSFVDHEIKNVAVPGEDLPPDSSNEVTNLSHNEETIPNTEFDTSDVNAIDWYYSNYFREYDPYASLPVGGNTPPNSASISSLAISLHLGCFGVWFMFTLS
ncbi:hypothetical protein SK128_003665 [Halocaridina rubra]|uniref:LRRCT domain-containing protein n=1 Tax=Halocaridina rubra TaxID=373956 RepID=A0AAN8WH45_HALRR